MLRAGSEQSPRNRLMCKLQLNLRVSQAGIQRSERQSYPGDVATPSSLGRAANFPDSDAAVLPMSTTAASIPDGVSSRAAAVGPLSHPRFRSTGGIGFCGIGAGRCW